MNTATKLLLLLRRDGGLSITSFTQALGSELLTNGDFSAWSGDNPTGWSVSGESGSDPAISEVGSGEDHTGVGTGSANWYKTAGGFLALAQNALTAGRWYEIVPTISLIASGSLIVNEPTNGIAKTFAVAGEQVMLGRAGATAIQAYIITNPSDATMNGISAREVTLNAELAFAANGTFELYYTLPASPRGGERVELWYRANGDLNHIRAQVIRSDSNSRWDFKLDKVSSGTPTSLLNIATIGTTNAIRVVANGNDHTCFTSSDGGASWTARGTTVTDSTHNTNTGLRAVYNSTITPTRLKAY